VAVSFCAIAWIRGDAFSLVIMLALAGSLLGFLPWNRPPARIFMGDTGALFIGLILAASSISRPSKSPTALILGGPMLALALPVLDTLIVMQRRFKKGEPQPLSSRLARVFRADRNHIHHILVGKYGTVGKAILRIWFVTLLFAIAAIMTTMDDTRWIGYGTGLVAIAVLVFLRRTTAPATS
jgi:UDP-GlcNAc:undecaprenyl-phosphate GlcNAc-1-phosphate transferase